MEYFIAVYSGSLQANRVKRIVEREISYVAVTQIPSDISEGGCNYAVKVDSINKRILLDASEIAGARIKGKFLLTVYKNGSKEYYRL